MGRTSRLTTQGFIQKAQLVHGDKYDYSLVGYNNKNETYKKESSDIIIKILKNE